MLRAIRFSVRFDFKIENESAKAILSSAGKINLISVERIREELSKMLLLENRDKAIRFLDELKITLVSD